MKQKKNKIKLPGILLFLLYVFSLKPWCFTIFNTKRIFFHLAFQHDFESLNSPLNTPKNSNWIKYSDDIFFWFFFYRIYSLWNSFRVKIKSIPNTKWNYIISCNSQAGSSFTYFLIINVITDRTLMHYEKFLYCFKTFFLI